MFSARAGEETASDSGLAVVHEDKVTRCKLVPLEPTFLDWILLDVGDSGWPGGLFPILAGHTLGRAVAIHLGQAQTSHVKTATDTKGTH